MSDRGGKGEIPEGGVQRKIGKLETRLGKEGTLKVPQTSTPGTPGTPAPHAVRRRTGSSQSLSEEPVGSNPPASSRGTPALFGEGFSEGFDSSLYKDKSEPASPSHDNEKRRADIYKGAVDHAIKTLGEIQATARKAAIPKAETPEPPGRLSRTSLRLKW